MSGENAREALSKFVEWGLPQDVLDDPQIIHGMEAERRGIRDDYRHAGADMLTATLPTSVVDAALDALFDRAVEEASAGPRSRSIAGALMADWLELNRIASKRKGTAMSDGKTKAPDGWELTDEQERLLAAEKPLTEEQRKAIDRLMNLHDRLDGYCVRVLGMENSLTTDLLKADAGRWPGIQPAVRRAYKALEKAADELERLAGYVAYTGIPKWKLEYTSEHLHIPMDAMIDPEYEKEQTK